MEIHFNFLEALSFLTSNKYKVQRQAKPGVSGYLYEITGDGRATEITDQRGVITIAKTVALKLAKAEMNDEDSYIWAM
jgi:hypothetical protein